MSTRSRGGRAMTLMHRARPRAVKVVDADVFTQTAAVLATRQAAGYRDRHGRPAPVCRRRAFGVTRPAAEMTSITGSPAGLPWCSRLLTVAHWWPSAPSLLALALITCPEIGADVAFGTTQRFGVPMGLAAMPGTFAARQACASAARPAGRCVRDGTPAYRWRCELASNTSAATRPPATSAPHRVLVAVPQVYASYTA